MNSADDMRSRVAREAAVLLYSGAEKEYKQAKLKAAETFGTHFLPTNFEVALELDKISEEKEGSTRKERLVLMRQEALKIMKLIDAFYPVLIGSVWRGTIRFGSDIDISVYSEPPEQVLEVLKTGGVKVQRVCWTKVNKKGVTHASYHIYAESPAEFNVEITVRHPEEKGKKRRCEIFGDVIKGLRTLELEKLLRENPERRFLP